MVRSAMQSTASSPCSTGLNGWSSGQLAQRCGSPGHPERLLAHNRQGVVLSTKGEVERETGFERATFCLGRPSVHDGCIVRPRGARPGPAAWHAAPMGPIQRTEIPHQGAPTPPAPEDSLRAQRDTYSGSPDGPEAPLDKIALVCC
jgi:hypothetical protein